MRGSRTRLLALTVGGLAMIALCVFLLLRADGDIKPLVAGALGVPFFGLMLLLAAYQLVRPPRLVMDRVGMRLPLWGRTTGWAWSEVLGLTTYEAARQKFAVVVLQPPAHARVMAEIGRPATMTVKTPGVPTGIALPIALGRQADLLAVVDAAGRWASR